MTLTLRGKDVASAAVFVCAGIIALFFGFLPNLLEAHQLTLPRAKLIGYGLTALSAFSELTN